MASSGRMARIRGWLSQQPVSRFVFGGLLIAGFAGGILFWGGYNWAMELSNEEAFCISCHEMQENVYQEYKETIHYSNRTGVRTTCSDCHVPKEWHHKAMRKIYATNELLHKILGTVDTPEKFNAKRPEMIRSVWHSMRDADSRECRNCHTYAGMALDSQDRFAKRKHERAMKKNETCIDCHQGIAHKLPDGWKDIWNQEFEPVEASESPDPAQPDATQG